MTCGIDNIEKIENNENTFLYQNTLNKIFTKNLFNSNVRDSIPKRSMSREQQIPFQSIVNDQRILILILLIPTKRKIWSRSDGSHLEEKSGQGATLTPKRNLVNEQRIPP